MKIINCKNTPNFGYNKEYHQQVKAVLLKDGRPICRRLSGCDALACGVENDVISLEKKGQEKSEEFEELSNLLVTLRSRCGFHIAKNAQHLKFPEKVIRQYLNEMTYKFDSINNHWRRDICENLSKYSIEKFDSDLEKSARAHGFKNYQLNKQADDISPQTTLDEVASQAVDNYVSKMANELVTKFEPKVTTAKGFDDVVGLDDIKQKFQEGIIDYLYNPELIESDYLEYGIIPPKTFLFYGPPGCGKTHVAEALAVESCLDMYKMDVSKLGSSYVNKTAQNIQSAIDSLIHLASVKDEPILLFMDEVDSLAINRDKTSDSSENLKTTTTLLKMLDQVKNSNLIVIAATNKFDLLDEAFISRFSETQYVGLPSQEQIKDLIIHTLKGKQKAQNLLTDDEALNRLSKEMDGYSNRSIVFILNEAARIARRDSRSDITEKCIEQAIEKTDFEKVNEKDYIKKTKSRKNKIGFTALI